MLVTAVDGVVSWDWPWSAAGAVAAVVVASGVWVAVDDAVVVSDRPRSAVGAVAFCVAESDAVAASRVPSSAEIDVASEFRVFC